MSIMNLLFVITLHTLTMFHHPSKRNITDESLEILSQDE